MTIRLRALAMLLFTSSAILGYAQASNPSVQYTHENGIHFITIELNDLQLRFQTALANDRGAPTDRESVQSMAMRYGAIAAINTDYFGNCAPGASACQPHGAEGAIYINGTMIRDSSCRTSLAISPDNRAELSRTHGPSFLFNVAGGGPLVLRDGTPIWSRGGIAACAGCSTRDIINGECFPGSYGDKWDAGKIWSAAALTRDGSKVILAVSDSAVTPQTMARSLATHGAYTAMKLDGGSSSALFYDGKVLKAGRNVAEALLVLPRNPHLDIVPTQGKTGDIVMVTGRGFTPNRAAISHLRKPDGSESGTLSFTTDPAGSYTHPIHTNTFSSGTYETWWEDQATGIRSNATQFQLTGPIEVDRFVGKWIDVSQNSGLPWIEIKSVPAGLSVISLFGQANNVALQGPTLTASFMQSLATRTQTLALEQNGRMRVDTHTHFTDQSGRRDYDLTQYFVRENLPPTPPATPTKQITVISTQPWTSTGIIVRRGQTVTFKASGSVHCCITNRCGDQRFNRWVAPEGFADLPHVPGPAPEFPAVSLIGRIDNSRAFYVARGTTIVADTDGELFLGVNDWIGEFWDNAGAFIVEVTVSR